MNSKLRSIATLSFLLTATGCTAQGSLGAAIPGHVVSSRHSQGRFSLPISNYIKHVVIVVQENRSFDNLFAGFPGAATSTYGYMHDGTRIPLRPVDWNAPTIYHGIEWVFTAFDGGKMDGFDLVPFDRPPNEASGTASYGYLERNLIAPYWTLARRYTLADHMFPTSWGGSFSAHLDLIAGTTNISPTLAVTIPNETPWGCDAPSGTQTQVLNTQHKWSWSNTFPCFTQFSTMADTLDATQTSWKYYAPSVFGKDYAGKVWSEFDAISNVRNGPDWANNVISPETTILTDVTGGTLASVSWVVPSSANSDHDQGETGGPSWVSSIVNTIGQSKYWSNTAIVVLWDDWGGWYDNVPPPQLDFVGLGFRVPCIIISPYSKAHYVSHTQYEYGSILKFIEQTFNVPSLGYSDARANSIVDAFDFTQPPHHFTIVQTQHDAHYFLHQRPTKSPPDDE